MGNTDHIFSLNGLISHYLNNNKTLLCEFIDFSKAFDYIVRDNLWYKLIKLSIRGNILTVVMSMYQNVKYKIKFDGEKSDTLACYTGVRQGECLSPFLFSMVINNLEDEFILNNVQGLDLDHFKIFLLMYADDIVVFSETAEGLQNGLNCMYQLSKVEIVSKYLEVKGYGF